MASKILSNKGFRPCPFCGHLPIVKQGATLFADCAGCTVMWGKDVPALKAKWNRRKRA